MADLLMRFVSFSAVALAAASLATGAVASGQPKFSLASLPGLVAPKPPLPKNTPWLDLTTSDGDSRAFNLQSSWIFEPGLLMNAVQRAGFRRGYRRLWGADKLQTYDYREVRGFALLFRTASGARIALTAMHRDDRKHMPPGSFLRWQGFGDGSYGFAETGHEPDAVYEWRAGNVVLIAQADCGGVTCQFDDVVPVAHAYAKALEARAKRTS